MYMSRILIQNATKWQRATGDSTDSLKKVDTLLVNAVFGIGARNENFSQKLHW